MQTLWRRNCCDELQIGDGQRSRISGLHVLQRTLDDERELPCAHPHAVCIACLRQLLPDAKCAFGFVVLPILVPFWILRTDGDNSDASSINHQSQPRPTDGDESSGWADDSLETRSEIRMGDDQWQRFDAGDPPKSADAYPPQRRRCRESSAPSKGQVERHRDCPRAKKGRTFEPLFSAVLTAVSRKAVST